MLTFNKLIHGSWRGFPKFNSKSKCYASSNLSFILSHEMLGSEPRDSQNLLFSEVIKLQNFPNSKTSSSLVDKHLRPEVTHFQNKKNGSQTDNHQQYKRSWETFFVSVDLIALRGIEEVLRDL